MKIPKLLRDRISSSFTDFLDESQHFITEKIWKSTRLKCGWNFKYHLNMDCISGVIKGSCKCGSELNCIIERNEEGIVTISCSTTSIEGENECGQRFARGSSRVKLSDKLRGKSAHVVRAQIANEMMEENDPEPQHLPTSPTMRSIKSRRRREEFLHRNPIMALEFLSLSQMKDEIPWIGHKPFFAHCATKHQRTVYEKLTVREHTFLAIDAMGSIFSSITRVDGTKSGPIFLYIAVLGTVSKPYTVVQMISEIHMTGAIQFWLEQWIEHWGSAHPREVVCDCSSALLGAAVRAFSKHDTVNEYADEFFVQRDTAPSCYIRIDIAHLMKIFATLMGDVWPEVSKFYKVGIGKLALCRNKKDAERIIRALLTVSRSKNCGNSADDIMSACNRQKEILKQIITTNVMEDIGLDDDFDEQHESNDFINVRSQAEPSKWREWVNEIDASVEQEIQNSPGEDVNAHWLPKLADRLIEKSKWLPLWSCITRDRHGYGRVPASSAIADAEFGIIKNLVLKGADLPMRPDEYIPIHKNYVDGRCKLNESDIEAERQRCARRKSHESEDHMRNTSNILEDNHFNDNVMSYADSNRVEMQDASSIDSFTDTGYDIIHCPPIEQSTMDIGCPACKNGDLPGGAHRCLVGISVVVAVC